MPSALYIRIRPTTPWRIGPDSGDRDRVDRIFHSDSLYSAVTSAMARVDGLDGLLDGLNDWLDATARSADPAVRFSSCFPTLGNALYVVPPRNLWPPASGSSKIRWKGARFVPLGVVEALAAGKGVSPDAWTIDVASECLVAANPTGLQGPFRAAVRSSAAVDREGAGVAAHSTACLEFAPDGGLWAIAAFADDAARDTWRPRLEAALRLLADSGFGGERSQGWGRAEITVEKHTLPELVAEGEHAWWLLSLFTPNATDEIDWQRGNYAVATRSGRIESAASWGEEKRPSRMIVEGSVLVAAQEPRGTTGDVAPEGFAHPVYRAGHAVALRIPLKFEARSAG